MQYWFVVFANSLIFLSFQMTTAGIPAYLAQKGATGRIIGLATTLSALSALIIRPLSAFFEKVFSSKMVIVVGSLCIGLPMMICLYSKAIGLIVAFRIVQGFGWGLASSVFASLIANCARNEHISKDIGIAGALSAIATAFASPLAMYLLSGGREDTLLTTIAVIAIFVAIIMAFLSVERNSESRTRLFEIKECLSGKATKYGVVVYFITVSYSPIVTFVPKYLTAEKKGNATTFFLIFAVVTVIVRALAGMYVEYYRGKPILFVAMIVSSVALLCLGVGNGAFAYYCAALLSGIGTGIGINVLQAFAAKTESPSRRCAAMATYFIGFDLGMLCGSSLAGFFADRIGVGSMFLIMAITPIFGTIALLLMGEEKTIRERIASDRHDVDK